MKTTAEHRPRKRRVTPPNDFNLAWIRAALAKLIMEAETTKRPMSGFIYSRRPGETRFAQLGQLRAVKLPRPGDLFTLCPDVGTETPDGVFRCLLVLNPGDKPHEQWAIYAECLGPFKALFPDGQPDPFLLP